MVVSSQYDGLIFVDVYLCLSNSNEQNMYDKRQEIKSIIVRMLKNRNQRYSSHNSNIKCVDPTTIKCIAYLEVVSSFMIFSSFDSMFLLIYC